MEAVGGLGGVVGGGEFLAEVAEEAEAGGVVGDLEVEVGDRDADLGGEGEGSAEGTAGEGGEGLGHLLAGQAVEGAVERAAAEVEDEPGAVEGGFFCGGGGGLRSGGGLGKRFVAEGEDVRGH